MNTSYDLYRNQLLISEQHFQDEINRLGSDSFDEFEVTDRVEHASDSYSENVAISLVDNANAQLFEIRAALKRINDGTYGRCEGCKRDIPNDRLHAYPSALQCIECARKTQTVTEASLGK